MDWETTVRIDDQHELNVKLTHTATNLLCNVATERAHLRFLSIVHSSQIPFHIVIGSPFTVSTAQPDSGRWLASILTGAYPVEGTTQAWWDEMLPDSPLGILCSVEDGGDSFAKPYPRVTELLFYATRQNEYFSRPPTPPLSSPNHDSVDTQSNSGALGVEFNAVALSSDLFYRPELDNDLPKDLYPNLEHGEGAVFLPPLRPVKSEIIHEPPVKKRRTAADAFDEASERRKAVRRRGNLEPVASAIEDKIPTLKHNRSMSNSARSATVQSRPLSRSPSICSTKPSVPPLPQRSSLSQVRTISVADEDIDLDLESKNKEFISRVVMAGMRLFGLSQSKTRRARRSTATADPLIRPDLPPELTEAEQRNDEEFKLVYHQVFKGLCFAFRGVISTQTLLPRTDAVRDVADKLLNIFCNDPLVKGLSSADPIEKTTPSGRKVFGVDNG